MNSKKDVVTIGVTHSNIGFLRDLGVYVDSICYRYAFFDKCFLYGIDIRETTLQNQS